MPAGQKAEALFERYLDLLEEQEDADFLSFVAQHPEHAAELQSLFKRWSQLDAQLGSALPEALVEDSFFHGTERGTIVPGPQHVAVPGAVMAADYRLIRLLGQGGMGQVWEAEQLSLGRRVALKLLRPGRRDGRSVGLLAKEARAGGRLTHPGLVTVYAAGEVDGVHFIAQQLVGEGFTLADWIERRRAQPAADARAYRELAELFARVAEAVQVAHEAGILHRDLKPSNVLIGADDRPRVSDFGLAHLADDQGPAARPGLLGTLPYMSPEQLADEELDIDGRSDVFSLGAVLFEALTLRRAFEGDTGDMIMAQVRHRDPPDPRRIRSRIPADLAVICLTALHKDRRARYANMAAFAADLRRFLNDEPIAAQPQGWPTRALKWSRRHPAWTAAMASVSVALVFITTLLLNEVALRREAEVQRSRADRLADEASVSAGLARERADEAERQGYLAAIRAAAMHLDRGDPGAARPLLRSAAPDRRGWEWRHDALRADLSVLKLHGHGDAITSVALDGSGARLASASLDGSVRIWDGLTGQCLSTLEQHEQPVLALAANADLTVLVSGDDDGRIFLWQPPSTVPSEHLPALTGGVVALSLSRDGRMLASACSDGSLRILDRQDGRSHDVLGDLFAGPVNMALAPDGSALASASRFGKVLVHTLLATGPQLLADRYWESEPVVALSSGGQTVITGAADGSLLAWRADAGAYELDPGQDGVTVLRGHAHPVSHVAVSDDLSRVVSASDEDNTLRLWELPSGQLRAELTGHDARLSALAVSADGRAVLAGSADGTALLWDGDTLGARVALPAQEQPVSTLAVSRDGSTVVSGSLSGGLAVVWDGVTGERRLDLPGHPVGVSAAAISADGRLIVTAGYDRFVRLWDGITGQPLPHLVGHDASVTSVAVDASGTRVLSGSHDRTARLWDAATGKPLAVFRQLTTSVTSVALDDAGQTALLGAQDGSVLLLKAPLPHQENIRTLSTARPASDGHVALSADGSTACWASASRDEVWVWDTLDETRRKLHSGSLLGLAAVALSADGVLVLTAGSRDDGLRLRESWSGDTLALLQGHDGQVTAVAFTADGQRILSGGRDRRVRVWESDPASARALWRGLDGRP